MLYHFRTSKYQVQQHTQPIGATYTRNTAMARIAVITGFNR